MTEALALMEASHLFWASLLSAYLTFLPQLIVAAPQVNSVHVVQQNSVTGVVKAADCLGLDCLYETHLKWIKLQRWYWRNETSQWLGRWSDCLFSQGGSFCQFSILPACHLYATLINKLSVRSEKSLET
jgi:hypothetical protein